MLNENIAMVTEECSIMLSQNFGRSASRRFSLLLTNAEIYGKKKLSKDEILERYRKFCQSLETEKRCD